MRAPQSLIPDRAVYKWDVLTGPRYPRPSRFVPSPLALSASHNIQWQGSQLLDRRMQRSADKACRPLPCRVCGVICRTSCSEPDWPQSAASVLPCSVLFNSVPPCGFFWCRGMSCHTCDFISFHISWCDVLTYTSCHVLSWFILSSPLLTSPIISYHSGEFFFGQMQDLQQPSRLHLRISDLAVDLVGLIKRMTRQGRPPVQMNVIVVTSNELVEVTKLSTQHLQSHRRQVRGIGISRCADR